MQDVPPIGIIVFPETDIPVRARAAGKGFPTLDGYIAAIAAAHGFAVNAAGLKVIDPWPAR